MQTEPRAQIAALLAVPEGLRSDPPRPWTATKRVVLAGSWILYLALACVLVVPVVGCYYTLEAPELGPALEGFAMVVGGYAALVAPFVYYLLRPLHRLARLARLGELRTARLLSAEAGGRGTVGYELEVELDGRRRRFRAETQLYARSAEAAAPVLVIPGEGRYVGLCAGGGLFLGRAARRWFRPQEL
jgi:hypothetical protein